MKGTLKAALKEAVHSDMYVCVLLLLQVRINLISSSPKYFIYEQIIKMFIKSVAMEWIEWK